MGIAKRLLVGALTLVIGIFAIWLVLAGVGWVGREVVLHFGGRLSDWALSTDLLSTGALGGGLLVMFIITVVFVLLAGGPIWATLNFVGAYVLDLMRPRAQGNRRNRR